MIDQDEAERKKIEALGRLSIDELEERIAALKHEIELCETEIVKKRIQKDVADSLFS